MFFCQLSPTLSCSSPHYAPPDLTHASSPTPGPQLRHALALATVLGRTLILPPLWCGLDRYWAPHAGTVPGAGTTLPFQCPADHVLRLEGEAGQGVGRLKGM
jgi:hypothetical protein